MTTDEAIKHFGSPSKLARALGITPQSVADWGSLPPIGRQFQLQILTNGILKADCASSSSPLPLASGE